MSFESKSQRRFMFAKHPEIAEEFAKETPKDAKLPEHVKKMADGGMADDQPDTEQADQSRIQDSNPGHSPQDLNTFLQGEEKQISKYGPDQEKMVLDSIMKNQGSFGNRASRGLAGLGDAIMGVAGKSSPGFLNSLENREAAQNKMALEAVPQLSDMAQKNIAAKNALEEMNSNTPLGSSTATAYAPFFKSMGVPDDQIATMLKNPSAAKVLLEPYSQVMSKQQQMQVQTMLRQMELQHEQDVLNATKEKQAADIAHQKTQEQLDQSKYEAEHPIISFFNKLRGQGAPSTPATPSAPTPQIPRITTKPQFDALPSGSHFIDANGKPRVKK